MWYLDFFFFPLSLCEDFMQKQFFCPKHIVISKHSGCTKSEPLGPPLAPKKATEWPDLAQILFFLG